ncbi:MAG: HAD family hydrolase [Candidatus Bipolaricaulia bacterium]
MIETMIFDLDGTLVQTEKLKAQSYARAAVWLCPGTVTEAEVLEAFKDVVGRSRREVAMALMERFNLHEAARVRMDEYGVDAPWQAFLQARLDIYEDMITDATILRENQWPHNRDLLEQAREDCRQVALATMSHCERANQILEVLDLSDAFDFVATRDDVDNGKPDPEIYRLVAEELDVAPEDCLVVEDSPSGVQAAVDADMHVVAVATPFSADELAKLETLDPRWIVHDPDDLLTVVQTKLDEAKSQGVEST